MSSTSIKTSYALYHHSMTSIWIKNIVIFYLFFFLILFSERNFAQGFACPNVTVGPNVSICNGCTPLTAVVQGTTETTAYSVASVAYSPFSFTTGTPVLVNIDDTWSGAITIPFCFNFYGNTYTQCVIGSNGLVTFDLANANGNCPWLLSAGTIIPTNSLPMNSIMGVYEDIDPTNMGNIYYQISGTAPCRAFVISFHQIPYYGDPNSVNTSSCSNPLFATYQIVLYETTNIIDIYIENKESCSGWNGGLAIEGIQNAAGSVATVVSGRNNTVWTATNDGQRFTPTGAPQYTLTWFAPGNIAIGTTPTVSVCPTTTTTYTATVVNTTCSGPITVSAQVTVNITPPPCGNPSCTFYAQGDTVCVGGTILLNADTVTSATYKWTGPNGFVAFVRNPSIASAIVTQSGWYYVTDTIPGCSSTDSVFVLVNPNPTADAGSDQTICSSTVTLAGSITIATSGTWSGGAGTYSPNSTTLNCIYTPSAAENTAGTVTLTLTTDDPAGPCNSANDQMIITINAATSISAGPDQTICTGNTVALAGLISGSGTGSWSGGVGTYNPDNTNPSAVYSPSITEASAGTVTLIFTSDNSGTCTGTSDQMVITINQLPTANAGSAQNVCLGSSITLAGSIGGSAASGTWSGGNGTYLPNNTALNAVYTPSATEYSSGSVTLTLTTDDPAGPCSFSSSNVTHYFYENPVVDFSTVPSTGCPVLCSNFTNLTSIGGGGSIANWNWDFGDGTTGETLQNPSHCFSIPGFYTVTLTATSNNGCIASLAKPNWIHVFSFPIAEFNFTPNPASVLDPTITFNNLSTPDVSYWNWNFGDSLSLSSNLSNPVYIYPDEAPGNYMVTLIVHNADGCYDTVAHPVIIGPGFTFYIPNAFSPNGDGNNDFFYGSGTGITKYDLWIFDRWGNMLFHGLDLNDQWNGKAKTGSDVVQTDVYVWKVRLTDLFNKTHNYIGTAALVK